MDEAKGVSTGDTQPTPKGNQESGAQPTQDQSKPTRPTDPKTSRGKSFSSRNAIKSGLYCRELLIAPEEKPEFIAMRNALKLQLAPNNPIKWTAFEQVVVACWHYKLAVRMVNRQIARQLEDENRTTVEPDEAEVMPVVGQWFGRRRTDIRQGVKIIDFAKDEFRRNGYFKEETRAELTRAFGIEFVYLLGDWNPMTMQAIMAANQIVAHCENFGGLAPPIDSCRREDETDTKVLVDPSQKMQLVSKLLEQQRMFLKSLILMGDRNLAEIEGKAGGSDLRFRFLTDANRELRRALDWYLHVEDHWE